MRRLLSNEADPALIKDADSARESLSALELAGDDVESVILIDSSGRVIMSDPTDEVGGDVQLSDDVRTAITERRPAISGVRVASDGKHSVVYHSVPVLEETTYGQVLGVVRSRSSVAACDFARYMAYFWQAV